MTKRAGGPFWYREGLAASVGFRGAPFNEAHVYHSPRQIRVEEDAPIADPTAEGGGLLIKAFHVAGERIRAHLLKRRIQALSLISWGAA